MTEATSSPAAQSSDQPTDPVVSRSPVYAAEESLLVKLEAFFYARETPYAMALLRILLPWA